MQAHIIVRTLPLARDWDEGDIVTVVERGKELKMKLVESAFRGEREIKVIPVEEISH